jgi:hypothetical protein
MVKLAPTYYRKLDLALVDIGRYRELPAWRKDFKAAWAKAKKTPTVQFHSIRQSRVTHPSQPDEMSPLSRVT